jgi:DNA-binding NarL/FixJ family response regulator
MISFCAARYSIFAGEYMMTRVLIVEDHKMFREILKETLIVCFPSLEIEVAADGKHFLERIKEQNPDLIFIDIQLPYDNGLNLTKMAKSFHADIQVVIITGYDNTDYRYAASQAGADYFFSKKELKTIDIIEVVESVISRKMEQE